jgi:hypothetical protein
LPASSAANLPLRGEFSYYIIALLSQVYFSAFQARFTRTLGKAFVGTKRKELSDTVVE